jgi:hypothetical protein
MGHLKDPLALIRPTVSLRKQKLARKRFLCFASLISGYRGLGYGQPRSAKVAFGSPSRQAGRQKWAVALFHEARANAT